LLGLMASVDSSARATSRRRASDKWLGCKLHFADFSALFVLTSIFSYPYEATWVVANLHISLPTPESHPDFPLWKVGYSPEELWDIFWPDGFQYVPVPWSGFADCLIVEQFLPSPRNAGGNRAVRSSIWQILEV
jgi:hypothetical protein